MSRRSREESVDRPVKRKQMPAALLTIRHSGRDIVGALCANAAKMGVLPGMDVTNARALMHGEVFVQTHRPDRDAAALRLLAAWCNRFAPVVAVDGDDGLLIDVSGTQRMYKSEERLLATIHRALTRLGLCTRLALAGTFGCAWALARFGAQPARQGGIIVPPGRERDALAPLLVQALQIGLETQDSLEELGILTIGQLLALPRSSLPARFGEALPLRIDQALGQAIEIIEPVRPLPPLRVEMVFEGPTTNLESVLACALSLVRQLALSLAQREQGVRHLDVFLARADHPPVCLSICLSRPNRDEKHLWSLLRPHLERADMGDGIEGMTMIAARTGRTRHTQTTAAGLAPDEKRDAAQLEEAAAEMTDTLVNRLGAGAVLRIVPVESHIPERAFARVSVMEQARGRGVPARVCEAPRPSFLYEQPEAARVISLTPDGPVYALHWRGQDWPVAMSIGPERISPQWWREAGGFARDYYRVCVEGGRWLWMFYEWAAARWWVHGEWA